MNFARIAFPNAYIPRNTLDALVSNPGEKPTLIVTDGNPFSMLMLEILVMMQ